MAGRFGLSCLDDPAPLTSFLKQPLTHPCLLGTKREAAHLRAFCFVLFYLFKVRFSWYKTSIMLLLFREAPGGELLHVCYLTGGLMTFIGGRWPSQFWGSHYHSGWGYFFICRVPLCQGNIPLILHIIAQVLHPSLPFWDTLKCTRDTWVHPSSSCNSWGVFSCPSLCTTSPSRCWCIRHICCLGVLLRMSCVPAHAVKAPCQAGEGARSRR